MPDRFEPQTIEMALKAISGAISTVGQTEVIDLSESGGRTLARAVLSPKDVPEYPLSAMDGYSFHSQSLDKTTQGKDLNLPVLGKSLAGHSLEGETHAKAAARIFTGAMVPACHDTVIAQELVRIDDRQQSITFAADSIRRQANVRRQGEDLARGAEALPAGAVIGPREIALLASMGIASIEVVRRVRIAVLSTGDEVTEPGRPLAAGKTYDANRPMLLQMIRDCRATPIDLGIVNDDPQSLRQAILHAATIADAVITSGGVSVGEADHTRKIMESLGEISFWKLAIKPGRPLAAGWISTDSAANKRIPFFGLPGNPVAAFVTFQSIVAPCLRQLAGDRGSIRPTVRARLEKDARKAPGRTEYLRCALVRDASGEWVAEIAASQGAASLKSLTDADGLVVLPHAAGPLTAGTMVDVILL